MKADHISPSITENSFNCPRCGAFSHQRWHNIFAGHVDRPNLMKNITTSYARGPYGGEMLYVFNSFLSVCDRCNEFSYWIEDRLVYPLTGNTPPANSDLPDDILRDYNEASSILDLSPRGAAALVRLCIQKLCAHLGKPGKNINDDIAALVQDGLDPRVQKALDIVRVIGNNAVHPGAIDLADDRATAESLFKLLNLIAEKMISEPKHVDELYNTLPAGVRDAIEKRDGKANP
ncbi:DUF4145 domain-containing protein [Methylocystis heyeri]|uniref:DUF4145 domain-containing protein n=1 Tax=Methylocystis heyeri TaxID=391905 RepID=A0A6B8KIC1_9HYPH|nr:DUF4145 domain-containing protein [Methylocystis heyeri]QGM46665.1 DUF4145 domain-containing protein [Methylocystis heyeri]